MAIRFQCGACAQPIEVDDQWASRTVACPYCHRTVTAPAESTLGDLSRVPTATPFEPQGELPAASQPYGHSTLDVHPNRIAFVALVLALATVGLLGLYSSVLGAHRLEMETLIRPDMTFGEQMQAFSEYIAERQGRMPAWIVALAVLPLSAGAAWIAALVCGIVAVRRPRRRGLAIAALSVAAAAPLVLCCGGILLGPIT